MGAAVFLASPQDFVEFFVKIVDIQRAETTKRTREFTAAYDEENISELNTAQWILLSVEIIENTPITLLREENQMRGAFFFSLWGAGKRKKKRKKRSATYRLLKVTAANMTNCF